MNLYDIFSEYKQVFMGIRPCRSQAMANPSPIICISPFAKMHILHSNSVAEKITSCAYVKGGKMKSLHDIL